MPKKLELPLDAEVPRSLAAGDEVELYGPALTMRDAALKRAESIVRDGGKPPFDVAGQLVFHAGPTPPAAGRPAGAIGPTTSARMDRFLPLLFDMGCRATLGKGPRSAFAAGLHGRYGAVYLAAVGGIAALFGGMVEGVELVAWGELGAEAVYRVTMRGLPALVAIASRGKDWLAGRYELHGHKGPQAID